MAKGRRGGIFELASCSTTLSEHIAFDIFDNFYDVAWSKFHDSLIIVVIVAGFVKIYDTALPPPPTPSSLSRNTLARSTSLIKGWKILFNQSLGGKHHWPIFKKQQAEALTENTVTLVYGQRVQREKPKLSMAVYVCHETGFPRCRLCSWQRFIRIA